MDNHVTSHIFIYFLNTSTIKRLLRLLIIIITIKVLWTSFCYILCCINELWIESWMEDMCRDNINKITNFQCQKFQNKRKYDMKTLMISNEMTPICHQQTTQKVQTLSWKPFLILTLLTNSLPWSVRMAFMAPCLANNFLKQLETSFAVFDGIG